MVLYKAKRAKELSPLGSTLVDKYNEVHGSSGPYCNPDSLVAVIETLACELDKFFPDSKAPGAVLRHFSQGLFSESTLKQND